MDFAFVPRLLSRVALISLFSAASVGSALAQSGGSLEVVPDISTSTITLTVTGQGSKATAMQALAGAEDKLKEFESKGKAIAKGGFSRQSHSLSFSTPGGYPYGATQDTQNWQYTFTANYTLKDAKEGAAVADELGKGPIQITVSKDVQGQ